MDSRGFILLESTIVYVILGFAVVALMPLFIMTLRAGEMTQTIAVATSLSSELLEEVRLRRWDETSPPGGIAPKQSPLGVDPGEDPTDKKTFNDIDDFDGWTESPPQDPMGAPLPSFAKFTRTVRVRYVDAKFNSASQSDLKQVTVCTSAPSMNPVCLDALFANR